MRRGNCLKKIISCCGAVCSGCEKYPNDCKGCSDVKGKVFWLEFTGGMVCDIYNCCVDQKRFDHCGQCSSLPCQFFLDTIDPNKTKEENEKILESQLYHLKSM